VNTLSIWDLHLPYRALKALLAVFGTNDVSAQDVSHLTEVMVLRIPNCGRKSLNAIREALAAVNMALGTEPIISLPMPPPFKPGPVLYPRPVNPDWRTRLVMAEEFIANHKKATS